MLRKGFHEIPDVTFNLPQRGIGTYVVGTHCWLPATARSFIDDCPTPPPCH